MADPQVFHALFEQALQRGPLPPGNLAMPIFAHGSMQAELYQPRGSDPQTPHDRDEIYIVARGSGRFFNGHEEIGVRAGSLIFVGAGAEHRFLDFSDDFATWVIFYGPVGGEKAHP